MNIKGKVRRQVKSWLKSGVIDDGVFTATSEGTPQGGVISPLLANIALHGLEQRIEKEFPVYSNGYLKNSIVRFGKQVGCPNIIRYADDFVILCVEKALVQRCGEIISEWLAGMGLELKPEKTRLTHTLNKELSEHGKAGFDFLGHHIQQYPVGKHRSSLGMKI